MKRQSEIKKCGICGESVKYISRHLRNKHDIYDIKNYYDIYIKTENEGVCKTCHCPSKFYEHSMKYTECCSKKCSTEHAKTCFKESPNYKQKIKETGTKISESLKQFLNTKKGNEHKTKLSINRRGTKNPMFGKTHTKEESLHKSTLMKAKILDGSFTPCITNSWANSKCKLYINGQFYRSSWEAAFQILNPSCIYEKTRIKYVSPRDKKEHTYIIDFTNNIEKILYEIKPSSNIDNDITQAKCEAAHKWADNNGYKFLLITNIWFKENAARIDYGKYDPKIKKGMKQFLHENKTN